MEEADCQTALEAIPRGMIPHLAGHIEAKGRFAPEVEFYVDLETPRTLRIDFEGLPDTCEITSLGPFSPDYLAGDFKQEVREGVTRQGIEIGPESGSWVPMNGIPRHVQAAMYLTEDTRFYENKGFVPNLIRRALILNMEKKRYAYGGSTISQQLVKNLFLTRNKTMSRKLEEAIIVWRMESVLTKDRILELYINCVEFGPNVYGIRRAAQYYFGKSPSKLTKVEGLFIAALKPAPWQGEWFKRLGMSPDEGFWFRRMEKLMQRMVRAGVVTEQELADESPFVVFFE
jgi:membrane peptidoglycan carboxypeptidase